MFKRLGIVGVALEAAGWFQSPGAYVLVDGQYGSTGKGAAAALLAMLFANKVHVVTTNAGPNSGHTGYWSNSDAQPWQKVMTQQIPVFAAVSRMMGGIRPVAYLNGGAVINPEILRSEAQQYRFNRAMLLVHKNAAVIDHDQQEDGVQTTAAIASTNKGVGRAISRKVMRDSNVAGQRVQDLAYFSGFVENLLWDWANNVVFVETAQGFSLGINQQFYPYTTSRECTVQQAIADASIPYNKVRKVIMTVRTYPIRVGNTSQGNSGGWYSDQKETSWEALGLQPELTTVTKRMRRVATWSNYQFADAVAANQPDAIYLSFMEYIPKEKQPAFVVNVERVYRGVMGKDPEVMLLAGGPLPTDVMTREQFWASAGQQVVS